MQQPSGGITPLDDVLRISGDTTVDELLASPLLRQEAPAVAQGLALDRQAGLLAGTETATGLLRQDLRCPCRGQGEPCLRDGGSYGVIEVTDGQCAFGWKRVPAF